VAAAMQYIMSGIPVAYDSDGIATPANDGGPGASLAKPGSIPSHPRQISAS